MLSTKTIDVLSVAGELVLENFVKHCSAITQLLLQNPEMNEDKARQLIQDTINDVVENGVSKQYYLDL